VINETAAKFLGIKEEIIGKEIYPVYNHNLKRKIIGVMKDFHFESLHQSIRPLIVNLFNSQSFGRFVSVRLTGGDYKSKIESIKEIWHKYAGPQAFEYFFFDEEFAKIYNAEERTATIAAVFSALAIFIACLGLLGLAAFTTEQRTKEVGVRKILGATVSGIVLLLSKEFVKWVLIANLIAWPIAYYIMNIWLEDFAYRINIPVWSFIIAGFSALIIALLTVGYQALKAALNNPVKSLRYE
ncbi:MAG: ABC transporter permease, partial [Ignavibacteria bacterium]